MIYSILLAKGLKAVPVSSAFLAMAATSHAIYTRSSSIPPLPVPSLLLTTSTLLRTMTRLGLLVLLASALGVVVATPVDEQVVFPGVPDKRWDWKDCGKPCGVIRAFISSCSSCRLRRAHNTC